MRDEQGGGAAAAAVVLLLFLLLSMAGAAGFWLMAASPAPMATTVNVAPPPIVTTSSGPDVDLAVEEVTGPIGLQWAVFERASGVPAYLVAIEPGSDTARLAELWKEIVPKIAADPFAQRMLSQLAGTQIEFVVLPEDEVAAAKLSPQAPPAQGTRNFLGVRSPMSGKPVAGGEHAVLDVRLNWTQAMTSESPEGLELLLLTINDYLLRHDAGCTLRSGRLPEKLPASPTAADLRKEVDAQVAEIIAIRRQKEREREQAPEKALEKTRERAVVPSPDQ